MLRTRGEFDVGQPPIVAPGTLGDSGPDRSSLETIMGKDVHVVPADDGWAVEIANSPADRQLFCTQEEAIAWVTASAKREQVALSIHGRDGKIREQNLFGHNPHKIPD